MVAKRTSSNVKKNVRQCVKLYPLSTRYNLSFNITLYNINVSVVFYNVCNCVFYNVRINSL